MRNGCWEFNNTSEAASDKQQTIIVYHTKIQEIYYKKNNIVFNVFSQKDLCLPANEKIKGFINFQEKLQSLNKCVTSFELLNKSNTL